MASWARLAPYGRYFFDTRDGSDFMRDEIGLDLDGVEPPAMRPRAAWLILPRMRFPAQFGGNLLWSAATKPNRAVLRAARWFEVAILAN
jgi:hypothetical protein